MSVGLGHAAGFTNADAVHHFERATGPSKSDLGASVNVLHAADVFLNDLSGDTKHHTEQAFGNDRVLFVGVRGIFRDIPLLVGFDQRTQVGSPRVARGVELLGEVISRVEGNGGPGQVHQTKGAETDSEGLAGDGVDLGSVCSTFFEQQAGLVQPWNEEAIDNKPWSVSAHDDDLTQHLAVLDDLVNRLLTRCFSGDHLDQAILGGVIEEMQTDKAVGSAGGFCQRIDRQRRRVGGEDGALATGFVKGVEHSRFHIEVLKHGFNHKIGVLSGVLNTHHAGDSPLDGINLCG